jgi:hypothetical protein
VDDHEGCGFVYILDMGSRKAVVKMSGTAPCGALNQPALSLMAKEQQYL